jgi:hypothetical protein
LRFSVDRIHSLSFEIINHLKGRIIINHGRAGKLSEPDTPPGIRMAESDVPLRTRPAGLFLQPAGKRIAPKTRPVFSTNFSSTPLTFSAD